MLYDECKHIWGINSSKGKSMGWRSRAFVIWGANRISPIHTPGSHQRENACPHIIAKSVLLNCYRHRKWYLCGINLHLSYLSETVQVFPFFKRHLRNLFLWTAYLYSLLIFKNWGIGLLLLIALNILRYLVFYLWCELWMFFLVCHLSLFFFFLVEDSFCHADFLKMYLDLSVFFNDF